MHHHLDREFCAAMDRALHGLPPSPHTGFCGIAHGTILRSLLHHVPTAAVVKVTRVGVPHRQQGGNRKVALAGHYQLSQWDQQRRGLKMPMVRVRTPKLLGGRPCALLSTAVGPHARQGCLPAQPTACRCHHGDCLV